MHAGHNNLGGDIKVVKVQLQKLPGGLLGRMKGYVEHPVALEGIVERGRHILALKVQVPERKQHLLLVVQVADEAHARILGGMLAPERLELIVVLVQADPQALSARLYHRILLGQQKGQQVQHVVHLMGVRHRNGPFCVHGKAELLLEQHFHLFAKHLAIVGPEYVHRLLVHRPVIGAYLEKGKQL